MEKERNLLSIIFHSQFCSEFKDARNKKKEIVILGFTTIFPYLRSIELFDSVNIVTLGCVILIIIRNS